MGHERRSLPTVRPVGPRQSNTLDALPISSLLARRMTIFKRGAFKGKKFELASTDRLEDFRGASADFMSKVFDFLPGDYLITDESSLRDFTDFASSDTSLIWGRITELYAIGKADVPSERLVDIFAVIQARRNIQ